MDSLLIVEIYLGAFCLGLCFIFRNDLWTSLVYNTLITQFVALVLAYLTACVKQKTCILGIKTHFQDFLQTTGIDLANYSEVNLECIVYSAFFIIYVYFIFKNDFLTPFRISPGLGLIVIIAIASSILFLRLATTSDLNINAKEPLQVVNMSWTNKIVIDGIYLGISVALFATILNALAESSLRSTHFISFSFLALAFLITSAKDQNDTFDITDYKDVFQTVGIDLVAYIELITVTAGISVGSCAVCVCFILENLTLSLENILLLNIFGLFITAYLTACIKVITETSVRITKNPNALQKASRSLESYGGRIRRFCKYTIERIEMLPFFIFYPLLSVIGVVVIVYFLTRFIGLCIEIILLEYERHSLRYCI